MPTPLDARQVAAKQEWRPGSTPEPCDGFARMKLECCRFRRRLSHGLTENAECLIRVFTNCDDNIDRREDRGRNPVRLERDEQDAVHVLRGRNVCSSPERRQNMMRLVDDNPMGTTCACPQFLNTRKKAFKECGSFFQSNCDKIHHRVFSRLCQHIENFCNAR